MNTSQPQGWTISEYRKFKVRDESSESDTSVGTDDDDIDEEKPGNKMKGYHKKKYKKIAYLEELLPE